MPGSFIHHPSQRIPLFMSSPWIRSMMLALALSTVSVVWLIPSRANAGACCASAAAFGVGRLLQWEKFAVGLRTTLLQSVGLWNSKGQWTGHRSDYTELEWRSEIWGMVGFGRHLSAYARVPWGMMYRRSGDQDAIGGGIGDLQAGLRWDILPVGSHAILPGFALTFNVLAPTGRATDTRLSPLGTEVTGRGAWMLSSALLVEKVRAPWFIQGQIGVNVPLPFYREDLEMDQRYGIGFNANLANGWELLSDVLVISLVLRMSWEDNLNLGTRLINNTYLLDVGAILALSWRFDPHWTLLFSINSGLFINQMGVNGNGRLTYTLGLRYGFF